MELDRHSRSWWRALWDDAKAVAIPLLTYWAVLFVAMGLFSALVFADNLGTETLYFLGSLWLAAIVGVGFGQLCAFARLRTGVVAALGTMVGGLLFVGMTWSALTGLAVLGVPLAILWLLFPFFAVSGLLSLRTSMLQVFSLFAPMVFVTASILYLAEASGSASRWFAGDKWAVWNLLTAPVLLLGVGMVLVYLASRERHRLHRWMTARSGPERATTQRTRGSAAGAALSGCGSLAVLAVLATVLTLGTGLLAPYLWRSAPSEDGQHERPDDTPPEEPQPREPKGRDSDGDGLSDREERRHRTDPNDPDTDGDGVPDGRDHRDGRGRPGGDSHKAPRDGDRSGGGDRDGGSSSGGGGGGNGSGGGGNGGGGNGGGGDDGGATDDGSSDAPSERVQEAVKNTGISLLFLLSMVLLTLLGVAVFGPPLRRTLLLTALRRPPWPVPPTRRVEHAWRLVQIALGDLGVERQPGDTAGTAVERAVSELPTGLNVEPLRMVAEIHDRVTYGLGLSPQDVEHATRHAEMSYQAVWDILGERAKVGAVYRWDL